MIQCLKRLGISVGVKKREEFTDKVGDEDFGVFRVNEAFADGFGEVDAGPFVAAGFFHVLFNVLDRRIVQNLKLREDLLDVVAPSKCFRSVFPDFVFPHGVSNQDDFVKRSVA